MVEVFRLNKEMEGMTFYVKPIPIKYNGKISFHPPFSFVTSNPTDGFGVPFNKHFSYGIVNGEIKLLVYGNAMFKMLDFTKFTPITTPNVLQIKVHLTQGFMDLSDSKIVSLEKYDIDYKDKYIIKNQEEYDELTKDIDEGQLYQVVMNECHLVLNYVKEQRVINSINELLSAMYIRNRGLKIKKIKKCINLKPNNYESI